jgi:hypothetical protein
MWLETTVNLAAKIFHLFEIYFCASRVMDYSEGLTTLGRKIRDVQAG